MYLQAVGLQKSFGARVAVDDVSLHVDRAEVVGLLGPNGAGKTTTFNLIAGLEKPDAGQILMDGRDITHWQMHRRALAGLGYLPQEASAFRRLSVEDNLRILLQMRGLSTGEINERVKGALARFGLQLLRHQSAAVLSGGERRRLEVARAVVLQPSIVLLDEPFTGLDPIAVADLQELIADLRVAGIGVLVTDHNVREMLEIVDRAYVIHDGKVLVAGAARDVARDAAARRFFFGERFDYLT